MTKQIIASIVLLYSFICYAQIDYKYLYINQINNNIPQDSNIQVFCRTEESEQVEPNLFKVDNRCLNIDIKIQNEKLKINLAQVISDEKFINISIFFRPKTKPNNKIIFTKRGDFIKIQKNCRDTNLCHLITIEFPKIVIVDKKYETTINPIFSKYIVN